MGVLLLELEGSRSGNANFLVDFFHPSYDEVMRIVLQPVCQVNSY